MNRNIEFSQMNRILTEEEQFKIKMEDFYKMYPFCYAIGVKENKYEIYSDNSIPMTVICVYDLMHSNEFTDAILNHKISKDLHGIAVNDINHRENLSGVLDSFWAKEYDRDVLIKELELEENEYV